MVGHMILPPGVEGVPRGCQRVVRSFPASLNDCINRRKAASVRNGSTRAPAPDDMIQSSPGHVSPALLSSERPWTTGSLCCSLCDMYRGMISRFGYLTLPALLLLGCNQCDTLEVGDRVRITIVGEAEWEGAEECLAPEHPTFEPGDEFVVTVESTVPPAESGCDRVILAETIPAPWEEECLSGRGIGCNYDVGGEDWFVEVSFQLPDREAGVREGPVWVSWHEKGGPPSCEVTFDARAELVVNN